MIASRLRRYSAFLTSPVLLLLWGLLSGCDGQPAPSAASHVQEPGPQEASDSAATVPKFKISWTMHQNLPVAEDAVMVWALEQKFNVDLEFWNLANNNYESLLDLKLVQGHIPDLFRVRQTQDLLKYQQQGLLAAIPEDLLNTHAPNILKAIREYAPAYQDYGRINGSYYGIPVINPTNIYRVPVVYRQDWLDKLGLTVPGTLADFERVIYAFANQDPDGNGIRDTYGLSLEGMNVVFGAFGQMVFTDQLYFSRKDQGLVIGALEPDMKKALHYLRKWYRDGIIDPEFITGENSGGYKHLSHAFIKGRIGMTSMGNYYHWVQDGDYLDWSLDHQKTARLVPAEATFNVKELTAKNPQAKIVFGRPVSGPDGKRGSKAYDMLMSFTAIGAEAVQEPGKLETLLQMLDYVSASPDPDEAAALQYGLQGTHWAWAGTGKQDIILLPPYNRMFSYQNTIGANIGMTLPVIPSDRRDQWASTLGLDHDGIYNALEVATPSLIRNSPGLIKLRDQAYIAFITGERPLEEFGEFVEEFMSAGGAEVLKEANESYRELIPHRNGEQ
ncbi:ABC transporter substrate-binding protein [Paenibacillus tritici]|uniref:ABC transporter substrate-binding protein n=1 Tax=Paenibacillus tritici TaxID=1873425 RepID=UPI001BA502FD|nr:ABC transporter substrate-binding protein [Paenibacillus tritici]QUL54991.1 ABC transporter substrate-binding protein [Paenibacillus tritici]